MASPGPPGRSGPAENVGGETYDATVNRTERLYALVEELRASAPRRRSARELAAHYEVSVRTIERDISALQQAGVPVFADVGRLGGYTIDPAMTLPPLNLTPSEAVAIAVALRQADLGPFGRAGQEAIRKILAVMAPGDAAPTQQLAARVRFLGAASAGGPDQPPTATAIPGVIERALRGRQVLELSYLDKSGEATTREVEPVTFTVLEQRWYLVAWCRLRADLRVFRLDRIAGARETGLPAPERIPADEVARRYGIPQSTPLMA